MTTELDRSSKRAKDPNITIEWSSEPLDSVREYLKSQFTQTVEEQNI